MRKIINMLSGRAARPEAPRAIGCVKRTISDMESDGVYFAEDATMHFEAVRAEMTCHYSGLPSVAQYAT